MQVEGSMYGWVAPRVATVRDFAGVLGALIVRVPALATAPPERQRLALTELSARVRVIESASRQTECARALARLTHQLFGQLSQIWWPGSVHALARRCTPRRALKRYGVAARSWAEVVERARALDDEVQPWADDDALEPRPYAATDRHKEVTRRLEEFGGSIFTPRRVTEACLPPAVWTQIEELQTIAAELRWLRGAVNPISWGAAIGRVRGIARIFNDAELNELLAPEFTPGSWAELLGEDPVQDGLIARRPDEGADADALYTWLQELFSAGLELDARVELAEPLSDDIASLEPSHYEERRLRKQLRKLIAALSTDDGCEVDDEATRGEPPARRRREPPHVHTLRPLVSGMRAVFVTNRASPGIKRGLARHLGLKCDVVVNKVRRRQQVVARIRGGRYDFVLLAEGFSSHGDSDSIHGACTDAGVPHILVKKGRLAKICHRLYAARSRLEALRRAKGEA